MIIVIEPTKFCRVSQNVCMMNKIHIVCEKTLNLLRQLISEKTLRIFQSYASKHNHKHFPMYIS